MVSSRRLRCQARMRPRCLERGAGKHTLAEKGFGQRDEAAPVVEGKIPEVN